MDDRPEEMKAVNADVASGGLAHFRNGSIVFELSAGNSGTMIVEV